MINFNFKYCKKCENFDFTFEFNKNKCKFSCSNDLRIKQPFSDCLAVIVSICHTTKGFPYDEKNLKDFTGKEIDILNEKISAVKWKNPQLCPYYLEHIVE